MHYVVGMESSRITQIYLSQTGTPVLASEISGCCLCFGQWTV